MAIEITTIAVEFITSPPLYFIVFKELSFTLSPPHHCDELEKKVEKDVLTLICVIASFSGAGLLGGPRLPSGIFAYPIGGALV